MFLKGIRIYNYRSIDENGVELDNLGKVNVLIGKNNSGKSNILRFIAYLKQLTNKNFIQQYRFLDDPHDYHNFDKANEFYFEIKVDEEQLKDFFENIPNEDFKNHISNKNQVTWVQFKNTENNYEGVKLVHYKDFIDSSLFNTDAKRNVYNTLKSQLSSYIYNKILNKNSYLIENFRQITSNNPKNIKTGSVEERSQYINGFYFLSEFEKIMRPTAIQGKLKQKFRGIKEFLKNILNYSDLEISVSIEQTIQLALDKREDREMPLGNLGTGLHQLILLTFAATTIEKSIICIEEPELFVHPEVQKKFVKYLTNNTSNQYIITSHSSSFINEGGLTLYHITHDGFSTKVNAAISSSVKHNILDDLGYQASDLLLSNYIIWVEGPSDRIYIRHWIEQINLDLKEGVHYTIMFYGGRLLFHLSYEDESVKDFIQLSKINRNSAIFIDSDRKAVDEEINPTKQRVVEEFGNAGMFCLVTEGKEIENYIEKNILNTALEAMNKKPIELYDRHTKIFDGDNKTVDKITLAKKVIEIHPNVFETDGLKDAITTLAEKIKQANNL